MTDPTHYVRKFNRWVPEQPPAHIPWRDRVAAANPVARWSLLIGIVLFLTAVIVIVSLQIGDAAADGFGPLLPVTPSPTPYPNGWTP